MAVQQYLRKYKITVTDSKEKGWDVSELRCTFFIEKIFEQTPNNSIIEIYNLNPQTEAEILKEGSRVIVEAGYEGYLETKNEEGQIVMTPAQYGKIYDGIIIQMIRTKENNLDYKLTLVCNDGDQFISENLTLLSLAPNSTPRQIVNALTTKSLVKIETSQITEELNEKEYPRGQVFFGEPKQFLRRIAQDHNAVFGVEDGKLYLAKSTDVPPGSVVELTPETGLIGWPEQTIKGVEFKCLLNPKIQLRTVVKLNLEQVKIMIMQRGQIPTPLDQSGEFSAYKVTHIGDTRGNDWYTSVIGVGVFVGMTGKTGLPLLMNSPNQNPFGGG